MLRPAMQIVRPSTKQGRSTLSFGGLSLLLSALSWITDAAAGSGRRGLIELVREHRLQPLCRIGDVATDSVATWIGSAEYPDDVTVVLARAV